MLVMVQTIFWAVLLASLARASTYTLKDDLTKTPKIFYNSFDFFTGADPTQGFVNYVDHEAAAAAGLIGYSPAGGFDKPGHSVLLGSNHKHIVTNPRGRSSVRLSSKAAYNSGTLFIADIKHMPATCGAWSALWLLGDATWPAGGEVDWIEGGNALATQNLISLHTSKGCTISGMDASKYSGTLQQNTDCDAYATKDNKGCTIEAGPSSFGPSFNAQGGGIYALEWVDQGFNVWFFPRNSSLPASVNTPTPNVAEFGKPVAQFAGRGCDWMSKFKQMRIIINITYCGGWANGVWTSGGCAAKTGVATCEDYVRNHPKAFADSYFDITGLRVYEAKA